MKCVLLTRFIWQHIMSDCMQFLIQKKRQDRLETWPKSEPWTVMEEHYNTVILGYIKVCQECFLYGL